MGAAPGLLVGCPSFDIIRNEDPCYHSSACYHSEDNISLNRLMLNREWIYYQNWIEVELCDGDIFKATTIQILCSSAHHPLLSATHLSKHKSGDRD